VAKETIPAERLPDAILKREIEDVLAASGPVARRYGVELGAGDTLDSILAEGFDAVLIALGLNESLPLPGAAKPQSGVVAALHFLVDAKRGATVSGNVLVLGGGNTAIDAALSAKRAGASDVSIVYRRSFTEMPAWPEERDSAIRAGVNFLVLTQPLEYVCGEDGRLTGVKVLRTRLGEPGPDGRRTPKNLPGTEHVLPADLVIEAIGQQAGANLRQALSGVEFTRGGLVRIAEGGFATSRPRVYAAGDIVNGGATVVEAVAEGRRAAREIHAYLKQAASVQ
jgi:NADPH-dependent glutamate synthase beta subunit-like oxidoreductase